MAMNPWTPDLCPHQARRIGKTSEEVNELGAVLARISIQGLDAIDPSSGKSNRQRLHEETADVLAQLALNLSALGMDEDMIAERVARKQSQMIEWEGLVTKENGHDQ